MPPSKDAIEDVRLLHFEPNTKATITAEAGAELLVLDGELQESEDLLVKHSWLRVPVGTTLITKAGATGAKVWMKSGHLTDVDKQIARLKSA